ncbi:MAG: preprotein translocase subunit SecE [Erysipelotrichales bacterium]
MKAYFKGVISEAKRVIWPNKEELTKMTLNVLGVMVVFAALFFVMDILINYIMGAAGI